MAKDIQKQLQAALQKELKPLFVGLRNDLEALLREEKKQTAKKPPAIQKTEVTNHPEVQNVKQVNPQREVKILNPQKDVNVNGIKQLFGNLYNKLTQIHLEGTDTTTKLFAGLTKAIKAQVFKVRVENQLELPPVLKVEEQNPTEQKQLQDVRITNRKQSEAIPVVLVSHDFKRYYDAVINAVTGGVNLGNVKKLLERFKFTVGGLLKVTVGEITVITDVRDLGQKFADQDDLFSAIVDDTVFVVGGEEADFFLLKNPSASGIEVRIRDLIFISTTAKVTGEIRVYKNPTITSNGTALAESNFRDSTVSAIATAFSRPTILARGTLLERFGLAAGGELRHDAFFHIFLLQDEELLVTLEPDANNKDFSMSASWAEQDIA